MTGLGTALRWGLIVSAICSLPFLGSACAPESLTSGTFQVTMYLETSDEELSSLSFTVAYAGGGGFAGSASAVECSAVPSGASSTFSDDDSDEELLIILTLSSTVMSEDDSLAICTYNSTVAPTAANFTITVKSAADYLGDALTTMPTVSVKTITEVVVTTSTVTTTSTSLTTTSTLGS